MSDTNNLRERIAGELNLRRDNFLPGQPSLSVGLVINREINSAIQHYEIARFRWNEVRESAIATTVSGTEVYSLPASLVRLDTLKVTFGSTRFYLKSVNWEEIEARVRETTAQGMPRDYAVYGNVIRLHPIPNGAFSLNGSYIQRVRPTSLTPSYCSLIVMGGATLTATTTASHNNRLDGWTTDGGELVRARASAAVKIKYLDNDAQKVEMAGLSQAGLPFLSVIERLAFDRVALERSDIYSLEPRVPPVPSVEIPSRPKT